MVESACANSSGGDGWCGNGLPGQGDVRVLFLRAVSWFASL